MKTYLARFGNGTRRLFDAASRNAATSLAYSYGTRHGCGMLISVSLY